MASDEPALPVDAVSALEIARDQVVECVEQWSVNYRRAATIGHAGKVTQEFVTKQAGKGTRSVITVIGGTNDRLAGGSSTQFATRFIWFIIVTGTLKDRTRKGLRLSGEGVRLVTRSPWLEVPGSAFSRTPTAPVEMRALYEDKNEKAGLSVWAIQWTQAIDLGTAGRAKTPAPEPLRTIIGTDEIDGDPNPDTIDTLVGDPP